MRKITGGKTTRNIRNVRGIKDKKEITKPAIIRMTMATATKRMIGLLAIVAKVAISTTDSQKGKRSEQRRRHTTCY